MKENKLWSSCQTLLRSFKTELIIFFKDKALYVSVVLLCIIVSFVYSCVYKNEIPQKIPVAVTDMDNSTLSRSLVQMLGSTQQMHIVSIGNNMEAARYSFNKGDVHGIVYIPNDFQKDINKGIQSNVVLYSDASNMIVNKLVGGAMASALGTFNAQIEINRSMHKGINYTNSFHSRRTIIGVTKFLYNPYGGYGTFLLPVVYLIIMQTLLLTSIGVLGGTFKEFNKYFAVYSQGRIKDFSVLPVLFGRALAYLLICIGVFTIVCCGCFTVFKLPFRVISYADVLVFLIPFFLSVIFLGFSIMGLCGRREDASMSVTFISIPSAFLSGISWPSAAFPQWVNVLSYVLPSTSGARGFIYMTQFGASFADVKNLWIQLWLTALFYAMLATLVNYKMKYARLNYASR